MALNKTAMLMMLCSLLSLAACATGAKKASLISLDKEAALAYRQGDYSTAEPKLMHIVERYPTHQESLFRLATIMAQSGRNDLAIKYYQRFLTLRSDYAPAWRNLGVVYLRQGGSALATSQKLMTEGDLGFEWNRKAILQLSTISGLASERTPPPLESAQ